MADTHPKENKPTEKKDEDEQEQEQGRSYSEHALRPIHPIQSNPPDNDEETVIRERREVRRRRGSLEIIPPDNGQQIVMREVREVQRRRESLDFIPPAMRNDNNIDFPKSLLIVMVLVGALVGAVIGGQHHGSGIEIIWGAVVGFILAKCINLS